MDRKSKYKHNSTNKIMHHATSKVICKKIAGYLKKIQFR